MMLGASQEHSPWLVNVNIRGRDGMWGMVVLQGPVKYPLFNSTPTFLQPLFHFSDPGIYFKLPQSC